MVIENIEHGAFSRWASEALITLGSFWALNAAITLQEQDVLFISAGRVCDHQSIKTRSDEIFGSYTNDARLYRREGCKKMVAVVFLRDELKG